MTIIRKMTGTDQEMGISDAMAVLSDLQPFIIKLYKGNDFDLNQLDKSGIFFLTPGGGASQDNHHVPINGKWWYVVSLYTDDKNSFQLVIPDSANTMYIRSMTDAHWNQWNEIGGTI